MLFAPTDLATVVRLVTSMYELVSIHAILECREQGQDLTPLWVMYATSATQLTMVSGNIRNMAYSVLSRLFGKTKYSCIREIDQQSHSSVFQVLNASVKFPICFFAGTSFKETSVQTFRFSFIIDNVKRSYHVLQV